MKKRALLTLFAAVLPTAAAAQQTSTAKKTALDLVEKQRSDLIVMSDRIWEFAETALREEQSAKVLADYAEAKGFTVERGVAGLPTAFVASYGEGRPVIAIMGEYDALPGISQKASAVKEPLKEGAGGHGCGHNLFGSASLGAAVAIKELIASGTLKGTIRFLATPAEESIGGKIYMIRDGIFKDVDAVLAWHPGDETTVDNEGGLANVQFFVEFKGHTAHAAADPWNGRSATDAIEAFTHGVNLLREHVKPTVRMHYTVQRAGDAPNVIPDYARILDVGPRFTAQRCRRRVRPRTGDRAWRCTDRGCRAHADDPDRLHRLQHPRLREYVAARESDARRRAVVHR